MAAAKMFVTQQCTTNPGDFPLFLFSSGPKPLFGNGSACPGKKNKRTKDENSSKLGTGYNLMYDKRVCRGSYVMDLGPTKDALYYPCFEMVKKDPVCQLYLRKSKNFPTKKVITSTIKTTNGVKRSSQSSLSKWKALQSGEKTNISCQTDLYLETLQDEQVLKAEQSIQTDPFKDTDPLKLGIEKQRPCKLGIDKDTQIEPGELWDFKAGVAPVTENLTCAVIEQALLELVQEEELAMLMEQQKVFENKKASEMERLRRLQARQQALIEANTRKVHEEIQMVERAREAGEAVSVALFTKAYLTGILSSTLDSARQDGFLKDAKTADKEDASSVIQWVEAETSKVFCSHTISRDLLDDLIRTSLNVKSDQAQKCKKGSECTRQSRDFTDRE